MKLTCPYWMMASYHAAQTLALVQFLCQSLILVMLELEVPQLGQLNEFFQHCYVASSNWVVSTYNLQDSSAFLERVASFIGMLSEIMPNVAS